jgi:salicylate hydroxylase
VLDREPLERWTLDRIVLPADAAHPMLPLMAPGAATSKKDGLILARALEEFPKLSDSLSVYDTAGRPRAHWT